MKVALLLACVALASCMPAQGSGRFDGTSLSISNNGLSKVWSNVFGIPAQSSNPLTRPSDNKDERTAIVLVEYAVLPPVQLKFVEIFKRLQDAVEKDGKGVRAFGLSRTVDENLTFYLYSEWESMKDYGESQLTDAAKEFLIDISKIGVVWKLHILDQITFFKP